MSKEKSDNSQLSYKVLQQKIEDFKQKRDDLNKKTRTYITRLQEIEAEIIEHMKIAKETHKKKRDNWNKKVKELKKKKIEYKDLLDDFIKEKKSVKSQPGSQRESSKNYMSIKQIDRKIENFERIIETENLDISEENEIVDKIRELAELKNNQLSSEQNDDYFKVQRKIDIVKINLNKIYEQLSKWSNKSQESHKKMLELYELANELKNNKKKLEEELIENKKAADQFHNQYLDVIHQKKKISKTQKPSKPRNKQAKRPRSASRESYQNNIVLEKLKEEKLATAIEKQKTGKKLNIYEARLILERALK